MTLESIRRRFPRALPYSLAFTFACGALLTHWAYMRQVPAAAAQAPRHALVAGDAGATCQLSLPDQVKAVDAFRDMVPVFRHARCSNCHGDFDIFSPQHGDGEGAAVARNNGVDPNAMLTAQQRVQKFDSCNDCHSNVAGTGIRAGLTDTTIVGGWMLPPPPMMWTGLDDEGLCKKVKQFERDAREFLFHVEKDHGEQQFVDVAFRGDRALSPELMQAYNVTAAPPPNGVADFLAKANRWVNLLADQWNDPPSCGCVKPKVELIMRGEIIGQAQGETISGEFNSSVMLEPDTMSVYSGASTVTMSNFKVPTPAQCTIVHSATPSKITVKELRVGGDGGNDITLLLFPDNTKGTHSVTCQGLPHPVVMPLVVPMEQWRFAHGRDLKGTDYFFDDFDTTPRSANGRTMVGRKETTRTVSSQGANVTAKTVFELWTVPPGQ